MYPKVGGKQLNLLPIIFLQYKGIKLALTLSRPVHEAAAAADLVEEKAVIEKWGRYSYSCYSFFDQPSRSGPIWVEQGL